MVREQIKKIMDWNKVRITRNKIKQVIKKRNSTYLEVF